MGRTGLQPGLCHAALPMLPSTNPRGKFPPGSWSYPFRLASRRRTASRLDGHNMPRNHGPRVQRLHSPSGLSRTSYCSNGTVPHASPACLLRPLRLRRRVSRPTTALASTTLPPVRRSRTPPPQQQTHQQSRCQQLPPPSLQQLPPLQAPQARWIHPVCYHNLPCSCRPLSRPEMLPPPQTPSTIRLRLPNAQYSQSPSTVSRHGVPNVGTPPRLSRQSQRCQQSRVTLRSGRDERRA